MVALPCLAVGILMKLVAVLFVLVALALILIVLIQKGRGGGLSAAFGGGGAGGVLGTKTGDFLTWVTIGLVCAFLILAVLMARYYKPGDYGDEFKTNGQTQEQPVDQTGTGETPVAPVDTNAPSSSESDGDVAALAGVDMNSAELPGD